MLNYNGVISLLVYLAIACSFVPLGTCCHHTLSTHIHCTDHAVTAVFSLPRSSSPRIVGTPPPPSSASMRLHSMNRRSVQLGCFLAGALSVAIVVVFIASFHEVLCWKTPWDSYKDVTIVPVQSSLSLHPSTITMPKTTDPTVSSITPQEAIHNSEEHYGFPSSIGVEDWNDSCTYTIVIQTYKRNDILHRVLTHYCTFCEAHKILVVWNNVGQRVPKDLSIQADSCCPTLIFLEQKVNTIRNRFYPYPEIQTEGENKKGSDHEYRVYM